MFPSSNHDNSIESFLKKSSSSFFPSDIQNPNSKQDNHDPPILFNFTSPFLDEHESPLNQIFLQNHHQMAPNLYSTLDQTNSNTYDIPTKKDATKRNGKSKLYEREADLHRAEINTNAIATPIKSRRNLGVVPRRRAGKKDRHSKICTAQGIRDRRMRLSLQVARKFFDLQDLLGYDKASKTIEWLFTKSKKAIKELVNEHTQANNVSFSDAKSESFLSECEDVSGIEEINTSNKDVRETSVVAAATTAAMPLCISPRERDERETKKPATKSNTKESREKARERARSRAREKMMVKRLGYSGQPNPSDDSESIGKLGFSNSPFDQESNSNNGEKISPCEAAYNSSFGIQQFDDVGTIEKFLGNSSSSAASLSDYQDTDPSNNFMGFFGNWDLMNNERANSSIYAVTNQVLLAGNSNSVYNSAAAEFP